MAEIPPERGAAVYFAAELGNPHIRLDPAPVWSMSDARLEEETAEEVAEAEEDEDHRGDDGGDQGHHRE
jgi:hypothetical protein